MTLLTDEEQKRLLAELYDTSQKIEQSIIRALKKTKLTEVPEEVFQLRADNDRRKAERRKQNEDVYRGVMQIVKAVFGK